MLLRALGAGLISVPLAMNNPGGHQMLHELGLRIAFADAIEFAEEMSGQEMSFEDFKIFAPFYLQEYYGDDREKWQQAMQLLSVSLCIPTPSDEDDDTPDQNYATACHAAMRKDDDDGEEPDGQPEPA